MINVVLGVPNRHAVQSISSNAQTSQAFSQSFTNELTEAIDNALSQFGIDPGSVQLTVSGSASQNNGASQNSASTSTAASTPSASPAASSPVSAAAASPATVATTSSQSAAAASGSTSASSPSLDSSSGSTAESNQAFDDAYWASQPSAVQQLRDMQDLGQRTQLAQQLAQQGYSIDNTIMVWGWDPAITTQLRESMGYTWVPSALQQPLQSRPGVTAPGFPAYDPNNPPAGSIAV